MTDRGRDERAALARKYQALSALRARRDRGEAHPPRQELRALAAEFPGCLRELDTLGDDELRRRAAACAAPGRPARPEPWMQWIGAYHALMRAALRVREAHHVSAEASDTPTLVRLATTEAGVAMDDAFVAAVLAPPEGRVGVVVLRALAARFDTPAATIAATLFPVRRPSPYRL